MSLSEKVPCPETKKSEKKSFGLTCDQALYYRKFGEFPWSTRKHGALAPYNRLGAEEAFGHLRECEECEKWLKDKSPED